MLKVLQRRSETISWECWPHRERDGVFLNFLCLVNHRRLIFDPFDYVTPELLYLLRILQPTAYKEKYNNCKVYQGVLSFDGNLLSLCLAFKNLSGLKDSGRLSWAPSHIPGHSHPIQVHQDLQGARGTAPSSGSACLFVYVWVQAIFLFSALTCKFPKADKCEGALCFLGVQTRKNRL